jgi:hypothetical protein
MLVDISRAADAPLQHRKRVYKIFRDFYHDRHVCSRDGKRDQTETGRFVSSADEYRQVAMFKESSAAVGTTV